MYFSVKKEKYEFLENKYNDLLVEQENQNNDGQLNEANNKIRDLEIYISLLKTELEDEKTKNVEMDKKYNALLEQHNTESTLVDIYNKSLDKGYLNNNEVVDEIYMQMKNQSDAFLHVISKLDSDLVKIDTLKKEKLTLENRNGELLLEIEKLKSEKTQMMDKLSMWLNT